MANACGECRKELQKPVLHGGYSGGGTQTTHTFPSGTIGNVSIQNTPTTQMRPRSLFTTHSYRPQTDDSNFQRYNEFSKYFETSSAEQWGGYSNLATIWRQPRNPKPITTVPYYTTEETCVYTENWREYDTDTSAGGAIATQHGIISLRLHNRMRVDMTIDRAVRLINYKVVACILPLKLSEKSSRVVR